MNQSERVNWGIYDYFKLKKKHVLKYLSALGLKAFYLWSNTVNNVHVFVGVQVEMMDLISQFHLKFVHPTLVHRLFIGSNVIMFT